MKHYVTIDSIGNNATKNDAESFISFANNWAKRNGYDILFVFGDGNNSDESIELGNAAFEEWNSSCIEEEGENPQKGEAKREAPMTEELIEMIEDTLKYHSDYPGKSPGHGRHYLPRMDNLARHEPGGSTSQKLSNLLRRYYKAVGVENLQEALDRIAEKERGK